MKCSYLAAFAIALLVGCAGQPTAAGGPPSADGPTSDGGPDHPPKAEFEPIGDAVDEAGNPLRLLHTETGIVLVLIPAGKLLMGSPESEPQRDGDEVQYEAVIDAPFYLGETEVTVGQWRQIMGDDPSEFSDREDLPVGGATWFAAMEFAELLSAMGEGGFRLPTEAEWEYACRAGSTTAFTFGDDVRTEQVNFDGRWPYDYGERGLSRKRPIPVRDLPANDWGLYQMPGNIWEWCVDPYRPHPEQPARTMPKPGDSRVLRGGAFTSGGDQVRSANREGYPPATEGSHYGLRIARSVPR